MMGRKRCQEVIGKRRYNRNPGVSTWCWSANRGIAVEIFRDEISEEIKELLGRRVARITIKGSWKWCRVWNIHTRSALKQVRSVARVNMQQTYINTLLFTPSASLQFAFLSFHGLLLCPFALERTKDSLYTSIVLRILLSLFLLLDNRQESCVFAQFTDCPLPLLLHLFAQLGRLLSFAIRILITKVGRRGHVKLGNIGRDWDGFMGL